MGCYIGRWHCPTQLRCRSTASRPARRHDHPSRPVCEQRHITASADCTKYRGPHAHHHCVLVPVPYMLHMGMLFRLATVSHATKRQCIRLTGERLRENSRPHPGRGTAHKDRLRPARRLRGRVSTLLSPDPRCRQLRGPGRVHRDAARTCARSDARHQRSGKVCNEAK